MIKCSRPGSLPRPLGEPAVVHGPGFLLKALREIKTHWMAGRQGKRSSHPTGRRAWVVSMWESPVRAEARAHNTYREISNNDWVICSKREGESSEEWTRVTERDHFYSKRLNSFLFPGSYLDFCFKYMQNSVWVFNSSVFKMKYFSK